GEVAAVSAGSPLERLEQGLEVLLTCEPSGHRRKATVERAWEHSGELVLQFREIATRNEAEELRGCQVWIPEADRPPAPEGEFYLGDLVGCRVETSSGQAIGEVAAWHDFGAAPLLEVRRPGQADVLIPFTDAFYREVDTTGRRIVVELPEGLLELNG
ncbi:MAG TPA: ribosome maturation factor RimM, partial [Bryobacteraceae bacterium]|nr:ribosome maturation factor RimM [Bryobacteraceae bacterium]